MKINLIAILLLFIVQANAQQNPKKLSINYVEYADSVLEYRKTTKLLAGNVKLWFNDSVSYQQTWLPKPAVSIAPSKGSPSELDSIAYINYKKKVYDTFYSQKVNVCKITKADKEKKMFLNYDIRPGKTVAYFSPNVPRDSITLVNDQTKTILGLSCRLALYHVKDVDGNPETIKVWYTNEIALPFGPERFAQQLPGMVMKVESKLHNYTAIKLDMPTGEMPNFELEPKKDELYSYQEVKSMFQKRHDDFQKNNKQ